MIPCVIESPYAGDVHANMAYLRLAIRYCLNNNLAPFASHEMYTRALDDQVHEEREWGINAGFVIGRLMKIRVFFIDWGMSSGMRRGLVEANRLRQQVRWVSLPVFQRGVEARQCGVDDIGYPHYLLANGDKIVWNPDNLKWDLSRPQGTKSHNTLEEAWKSARS